MLSRKPPRLPSSWPSRRRRRPDPHAISSPLSFFFSHLFSPFSFFSRPQLGLPAQLRDRHAGRRGRPPRGQGRRRQGWLALDRQLAAAAHLRVRRAANTVSVPLERLLPVSDCTRGGLDRSSPSRDEEDAWLRSNHGGSRLGVAAATSRAPPREPKSASPPAENSPRRPAAIVGLAPTERARPAGTFRRAPARHSTTTRSRTSAASTTRTASTTC